MYQSETVIRSAPVSKLWCFFWEIESYSITITYELYIDLGDFPCTNQYCLYAKIAF